MKTILKLGALFALYVCVGSAFAATWYVQPNGGSRYDATNNPTGQCNGTSNANYPGSGVNQNCAFNDIRYLWADGSAGGHYVGTGGDSYIIANTYPSGETGWRVGPTNSSGGLFNNYSANSGSGYPLAPPSGSAGAHTNILGANYAACNSGTQYDPTKTTQIFGGFNVWGTLNLEGAQYVDVQCIELTDHNSCIKHGNAGLPSACSNSVPISDYTDLGISVTNHSSNITLQDMNIHGFPSDGIKGAIGGPFTLTRVRLGFNGFAGWNFDDGTANWNGASVTASYVTVEFNGCNEEYPIVDPIPATYCYSISNGGFGDGFSGQNAHMDYFHGDHLLLRYNVKDPFFGPHTNIADVQITQSFAYGNGGQTWKWNSGYDGSVLFQNNLTMNNCNRLSAPMTGAPSTYNTYFVDPCRADGAAWSVLIPIAGSVEITGNSFVATGMNTSFDLTCWYKITGETLASGGAGYQVGDVIWIDGGSYATVTAVDGSGAITGATFSTNGQTVGAAPFTVTWAAGGHGSGATFNVTSTTPANCAGGPRIMQDNMFFGVTDPLTPSYNGQAPALFCYSSCAGSAGAFDDTNWTTRSYNYMYAFKTGTGQCTYPNETCTDPQLATNPPTVLSAESQLDGQTFYPASASPLRNAGIAVAGMTTDYYGNARPNPPSIGAVEITTAQGPTLNPGDGYSGPATTISISTATTGCSAYLVYNTTGASTGGNLTGTNTGTSYSLTATGDLYAQVQGCPGFNNSTISHGHYTVVAPTPANASISGSVSLSGTMVIQ